MVLHIAEETDDDLLATTPTTHTTEDLFTIIHRYDHAHTYIQFIFQTCRLIFYITADTFPQKAFGKDKIVCCDGKNLFSQLKWSQLTPGLPVGLL